MYGLIGQMKAKSGSRDELIEILLAGTQNMPGCIQYVISKDVDDENGIWITEIWETKNDHENSLQLPEVQSAIAKGREFIAGFGARHELDPVGGFGLSD
ncbi:putative quinol monooxygenase [Rhodohalobacter halophilus]|uniref:putative quinol monooxygenase n=1 Tax=Rhodohalobacter halophilus TaxID=1812810 RepID=UPI00083FCF5C|nr:putative quinol monooxygenase [Rhodohalobacter halophilus]